MNNMLIKSAIVAVALLSFGFYGLLPTLTPQKPVYQPTEVQSLRLQIKQKDAQIAQMNMQAAQVQFQQAYAAMEAEAEKIRKENNWPDTVTFSPNNLTFSEPPAPPKSPEKKP